MNYDNLHPNTPPSQRNNNPSFPQQQQQQVPQSWNQPQDPRAPQTPFLNIPHNATPHNATAITAPPPPPPIPPPIALPPGWQAVTDPLSGRVYYANSSTGHTSWEPPPAQPPPPPPPPRPIPPPPPMPRPPAIYQSPPPQQQQHGVPVPPSVVVPLPGAAGVPGGNGMVPHAAVAAAMMGQMLPNAQSQHMHVPMPLPNAASATIDGISMPGRIQQVPNTLNTKGLLIPSTRALINNHHLFITHDQDHAHQSQRHKSSPPPLEFSEITSGTLADLARVQHEYRMECRRHSGVGDGDDDDDDEEEDGKKRWYYEPLKPFELPIISKTPHIEPGRVEIRLLSLMDALGKIQ